jgi:hypothetical protein
MCAERSNEYQSWSAMLYRCLNSACKDYKWYGGRGITVCERWRCQVGFLNFLLDMGRRPEGKTLDRENPEGHYEPNNCKWSTDRQQANNKRCSYTEEELVVLREEADEFARSEMEVMGIM